MELKDKINGFPKEPGIYMMKDGESNIIYVGKSKSLKDRVKSYFTPSANHSRKIQRLVRMVHDIEYIVTDTELDALLLECSMIQSIRPIYNTLMKNPENYSYIKIDNKEEYPRLEIAKKIEDSSMYFGPYTMERKLEEVKNILAELYKIKSCKIQTKCIKYDLNKCLGPCRKKVTKENYKKELDKIVNFLQGKSLDVINDLKEKMNKEIKQLKFEEAKVTKNNIDLINSLLNKQKNISMLNSEELIFAWIKLNNDYYKIYFIKSGKVLECRKILSSELNSNKVKIMIENIKNKIYCDDKHKEVIINKQDLDYINIINSYIKFNKDIDSISIQL